MTNNPVFRVGDVFASDPASTAILRLLLITRQLHAFLHTYLTVDPAGSSAARERSYFAISGAFGAAKEGADAFRDADNNGCFRSIDTALGGSSMKTQLRILRQDCDRCNSASLYCCVLKDVRDNAAWHWNRERLAQVLAELQNESFKMYDGSGAPEDTGIPIVSSMIASVMLLDRISLSDVSEYMQAVSVFHGRLIEVAHHVYYSLVRTAMD